MPPWDPWVGADGVGGGVFRPHGRRGVDGVEDGAAGSMGSRMSAADGAVGRRRVELVAVRRMV